MFNPSFCQETVMRAGGRGRAVFPWGTNETLVGDKRQRRGGLPYNALAVNGLPALPIAEGKKAQKLDLYDILEKSTASHQRPVVSFCNEKRIKSYPSAKNRAFCRGLHPHRLGMRWLRYAPCSCGTIFAKKHRGCA